MATILCSVLTASDIVIFIGFGSVNVNCGAVRRQKTAALD